MELAAPVKQYRWLIISAILVAGLGYFVDLYDLFIFNVVRTESLTTLGVAQKDLLSVGIEILDWTFAGMVLGGIIWGILGDRKGRLRVLFGSIIIYSLANLATAYIEAVPQYKLLRFISGFGLAGELGAGVTLVCELMPSTKRGYGPMLIAAMGLYGIVLASYISHHFYWRTAYIIGSCMGAVLLVLRLSVSESSLFKKTVAIKSVSHGNFWLLFTGKGLFLQYLRLILIGLPTFLIVGVIVTGAPEFGKQFGMKEIPNAGTAVAVYYICTSLIEIFSGFISQLLKSRKKAIYIFLFIQLVGVTWFLYIPPHSLLGFYARCGLVGSSYFPILMTTSSEQFGTNLRATATTTVPNFIRAGFIPLSFIFQLIRPSIGLINSAGILAISAILVSFTSAYFTKETFGRNLDFRES